MAVAIVGAIGTRAPTSTMIDALLPAEQPFPPVAIIATLHRLRPVHRDRPDAIAPSTGAPTGCTPEEDSPMSKYRSELPQLNDRLFVTDGGMETVFVFQEGIDLAEFASIDLLRRPDGDRIIEDYMKPYVDIATSAGFGLVMETATWRASPDWGPKIGFDSEAELEAANREAVGIFHNMRINRESPRSPIVVSGCIGPRGDGYDPGAIMSVAEASDYHSWQAAIFAFTEADLISAITMTNANEGIGVALAAKSVNMPAVISFTVETDGRLPTGQELGDAIAEVDDATGAYPAYYMINCAHPTHFMEILADRLIT